MITDKPIRLEEHLVDEFDPTCGAVVTFAGIVRSTHEGRVVTGIFYDCYHEMADREIGRIIDGVKTEFSVRSVEVVHRIGEVAAGEMSLLVVVSAPHRAAAFAAGQKVVDELKRRLPIWKKERYADAPAAWL